MDLSNRPIWLLPLIATVIAGVAAFAILMLRDQAGSGEAMVRTSGTAEIGGDFTLVSHTGETVTAEDFKGRPMLVFFGFTYCPDVCPFSLQVMGQALERMEAGEAAAFQPVLITVDPERDTPEILADYVASDPFPDNLVGLTGTVEQVKQAAEAYKVYYAKVELPDSGSRYTMDHTSLIYLMDGEGRFVDVFPHHTSAEDIAARLKGFLRQSGRS